MKKEGRNTQEVGGGVRPLFSELPTTEARGEDILLIYEKAGMSWAVNEHSVAVAFHARALAKAMAVQETAFLRDLEMGALLHDIGKIGVPARILSKCGPLTPAERNIVREHPVAGYILISHFEHLRGAARVVLHHHERFDGRGYPFGLSGNAIPLSARIFALADALDAMTSDRPYRRGRSFAFARGEIARCRGTQFDPDVVDAFLGAPAVVWTSPFDGARPARSSRWVH
ncbi:MAG: HD-GYP domain-containing protein [Candidatus Aminicenantes bacterium]|nr:HD-GYP domain-containing protein [Candidatus Aminicenantes bacterium]